MSRFRESLAPPATSFFRLEHPETPRGPVLVEVPHAGLAIPDEVRPELSPTATDGRLRDADIYVDKLYANAAREGAALLVARASRYVVDLNRSADDVDLQTVPDHPSPRAVQPRGVVWRLATDGRPLLRRPLPYAEFQRRLERFHAPYHAAIRSELDRLRAGWGFAIALAAHSMPSMGRGLRSDRLVRRADVVPGTRGGTTADPRLIELVDQHFRQAGLSVRHDDPYRGGYTTAHYGRPSEGIHVVQIELNRALYVDERTGRPKSPELEALRDVLDGLVRSVCELRLGPRG
ncbi:MAG: N-formylglutamate amidohydrolase [Myxococcota bacterium]